MKFNFKKRELKINHNNLNFKIRMFYMKISTLKRTTLVFENYVSRESM